MLKSNVLLRLWVLYAKEWLRLKRNPAALMAVGLIILMAFLISIENKASKQAKKLEQAPCVVVYAYPTPMIDHLKLQSNKSKIKFIQADESVLLQNKAQYKASLRCVAELVELDNPKTLSIRFKAVDAKAANVHQFSRWLLSSVASYHGNVEIKQSLQPLKDKSPVKTMGSIDLASNQAKAMIGAMMIFSAQFFLCCALFISFTAHEKERGILQGIVLTATKPSEIFLAKIFFHVTLSLIASFIIMAILSPYGTRFIGSFFVDLLVMFSLSSLGFLAIGIVITSLNRNQSTASLVGFCYLMLMGVVFALANKFKAFAVIKGFMFESHAIQLFELCLNLPKGENINAQLYIALLHTIDLFILSTILVFIAFFLFNRLGWRIR